jgi:hypothetical protein
LKIAAVIFPIISVGIAFLYKDYIFRLTRFIPSCMFYDTFGIACPACGNTRSVQALFGGDILGSLRYNITPPFLLVLCALFYAELVLHVIGRHRALVPRSGVFIYGTTGAFLLYYAARNFIPFLAI